MKNAFRNCYQKIKTEERKTFNFSGYLPLLIVLYNLEVSEHEDHQNQIWIQVLLWQHVDSTKHPLEKDYTENLKEKR